MDFEEKHQMILKVKRLDPRATLPTYATEGSAGLDLYALEDVYLWFADPTSLRTGIAVEIPLGYEGQLRGRSGLAFKFGVVAPHIGTIDSDYRGEINVLLQPAHYQGQYNVKAGERIAQLILAPVARVEVVESDSLSETARGKGGFGSSGR